MDMDKQGSKGKAKNTKESIHSGHRARMLERFRKQGLDGFNDHEALELLLYFAIPRGDTNPIAHRLMDTFHTYHSVIEATPEALASVEGIGEKTAALIVLVRETMRRYGIDKAEKDMQGLALDTSDKMSRYLSPYFTGISEERFVALATDIQGRVLGVQEISRGTIRATHIEIRKLAEFAIRHQAAGVIVAHNHPGGRALPSHDDMQVTRTIRDTLSALSISLQDHIIIAGDEFISMHDSDVTKYI